MGLTAFEMDGLPMIDYGMCGRILRFEDTPSVILYNSIKLGDLKLFPLGGLSKTQ